MDQAEMERAGALLALRNAQVEMLDALNILGYNIPPDVLARLVAHHQKHWAKIKKKRSG